MKNSTAPIHLTALLLALGFGNPSIGLGGDSCPPPNGCFRPTRWNFVNVGQKEKCGWPQFAEDPQPEVLKYYLRRDVTQTIAGSYSAACTWFADSNYSWCRSWNLDDGPGSETWSISSSAEAHLEKDEYSCGYVLCDYSGSSVEQSAVSDGRHYTVIESGHCDCSGVSFESNISTNLTTKTLTLSQDPSAECGGIWSGIEHTVNAVDLVQGFDMDPAPCTPFEELGWIVTPTDTPVGVMAVGENLSASGSVTLYPPTQAIYNSGQNLTNGCGTSYTTTNTTTVTLSKEFTTLRMVGIAKEYAETTPPPAVVGGGWPWSPFGFAFTKINSTETLATVQKHWYYFEFPTETNVQYTVTWLEITISDAGVSEHRRSWSTNGTGGIVLSPIFKIDPPPYNCFVFVADELVCSGTSPGSATGSSGFAGAGGCCGGGSASSSLGGPGPSLNGVLVQMGLGTTAFGSSVGTLEFQSSIPTAIIASPAGLSVASQGIDTDIILDAQGQIRQVKSQQVLADVSVDSTNKFLIRIFPASQIGAKSGGLYPTNGATEAVTYTIEAPNAASGDYNTVLVTELRQGGTAKTTTYTFLPTDNSWTLVSPGNLEKLRQWSAPDPISGNPVQYSEARDPVTDAVLLHEENEYKTEHSVFGRIGLVRTTRGTGADAVTKTYSRDSYYKLIDVSDSSGAWSHYSYNYSLPDKPVSMIESGFLNYTYDDFQTDPNLCRRVEYYYDSVDPANDDGTARPNTARTETEYLLGQFVSQTMRVVHTNAAGIVDWLKEYRMAVQNGDLSDPTNLVTTTTYITTGAFVGRVQTINNPDGTRQVYSYSDSSGQRTTTMLSGSPDTGNALNVLEGTRTITVQTVNGAIVSSTIQDKASSITLSSETYSNPDEFGRFRRVTHLDGTYEDTQYACCGLDLTIDRDGVVTQYEYDATGRQVASTRLNIKTTNILNSASQVLATKRIGSDGSVITLSQSAYNDAGEVARETNALNGVTTYATTADAQGYLTIKTTVYPDGGTRIENYFQDGQLAKVTGTAVQPVRYDYGVESDAASPDYLRPYSKEIKLDGSGTDTSEWSKSYTDVFGRSYKTVYAAASAPYPFTQSFFNRKGQLVKSVDPDSVTTLYQYKATGETEFTATDMNTADTTQDGNANFPLDLNVDRVTRATNDVYYNATYAVNVRRSQTYVYPTNSSSTPLLVSKQESSTDGLRGWQTVYRDISTPVVSASRTLYTNNDGATIPGYRTTTVTNLDTSKTVSVYYQGRLLSVARKSAANAQIAKTTYAYDAHGRQLTTTDARNGATTFAYNNADQMTSVTTPAPGNGQGPQTTVTAYDTSLRAWKVTQPDGTTVTNEFLLTGLLKRTFGSRTYPVGYSYDPQGRMKTMTNWSGFPSTGTRVTTWNYNAFRGFLSSKTYDGGSAGPSYTYTPAGRLLTRVWARGTNTTYAYNKAGDLSGVDYSDATSDVAYGYDRRGRQTVVTNGTAICMLTYNDASQLLIETNSGGTLSGLALTNAYDVLLRRSAMALKTQPSTLVQFGYDTASRLASVTNGLNVATYTYLANSPLVSQIVFKTNNTTRMTTTKQYDLLNRLQQIASAPGASGVSPVSFGYTYNTANQRTGAAQTDSSYWVYQYDSLGQVTSGKKYFNDGTPVPGQQFEFGFDDIGNRTSTKAGGDSSGASGSLRSATYAANTLNQYTSRTVPNALDVLGASHATNSVTVNGSAADYRRGEYFQELVGVVNSATSVWQTVSVTNSGGSSTTGNVFVAKTPELFYYDKDGNLTNDGRWLYTWDAENRLTSMTSTNTPPPGSKLKLDFVYDWQGRRIQKLVSTNNGSIYVAQYTNRFVYDGWNLMAILKPDLSLLTAFTWGLDLSGSLQGAGGVGGLLAMNDTANGVHFCAYDGNGNLTTLVKASDGTVSANWEYGPFGEVLRQSGLMAKANPFRFSTKYQDDESDNLYYGYRSYNSTTGRWLSRDPIEERGGKNIYCLLGNNSVGRHDLLGLQDFESPWFSIKQSPWSADSWEFLRAQLIVSVFGRPPDQSITISFKLDRPDNPDNKEAWNNLPDPRDFPQTEGWRWPNLAGVFNARGDMRYGGVWPPGTGDDNDFGAVVVRRQNASSVSMPLVSGDWVNDNGVTDLHEISHKVHIKERFYLSMTHGLCTKAAPVELWFAMLDMGPGRGRGWPREWSGTDVLYVNIQWNETFGNGLKPVFERPNSAPPASPMQQAWRGWKSAGAVPRYFDHDIP